VVKAELDKRGLTGLDKLGIGDWGLGIGDWGLVIWDWGLGIRSEMVPSNERLLADES
jgi:hypothetical protein